MEETLKKLEELGIEKENIKISRYELDFGKDYGYSSDNDYWEKERYLVENKIQIITKDLEGVPSLIDNIKSFKKEITTEVSFTISDSKTYCKQALDLAVRDANQNASDLASSLGIKIGAPSSIDVYGFNSWNKAISSPKELTENSFADSYDYMDGSYEENAYFVQPAYSYNDTRFSAYIQIVVEIAATYVYEI